MGEYTQSSFSVALAVSPLRYASITEVRAWIHARAHLVGQSPIAWRLFPRIEDRLRWAYLVEVPNLLASSGWHDFDKCSLCPAAEGMSSLALDGLYVPPLAIASVGTVGD